MKILLLLLATACFVPGGDVAHADPVSTAIIGFFKLGSFAATLVKVGVALAVAAGSSLLQKALSKQGDTSDVSSIDLSVSMGDDVPMSFVTGTAPTGGKRKWIGTWGSDGSTPNAYLVDVIELDNLPAAGLAGLWAGDTRCTILWGEPAGDGRGFPVSEFRRDGKDYLWVKFRDGSQTAVDDYLFAKFSNHPERQITANMIGYGCACAIMTCRFSDTVFRNGLPDWAFEMAPRRFYDLRKDATNGGFGAHRWNDQSTWEPTSNPVIVAYNIIRGITYNGEWFYGGQNIAAFRLPPSNWIAAANECDAGVLLADGSYEPACRCGYEISVDREPLEVIEELEKAANARFVEVGGIFKVLVGAPGAAVYSFTDDDVIVTEEQSFDPFPSLEDTFNGIEATYPEPAEKWAMKDAPARYDAALEAADGQRRLPASVAINAAPFANQVQRIMVAMIQDYRRFRVHQFYLPPDAYALEPNDVVSWTSDRNGYVEKKFLVTAITGKRTFNRLVSLKEIDPSDYDWSTDKQLPVVTGWIGEILPPAQPMYGWQAEPAAFFDADGSPRRPSIRISCAAGQEGVTHVWVQVALKATGTIVFDSDQTPYDPAEEPADGRLSWVLNGTFLPNETYQVRGRFISSLNDNQQWSAWLDVITFNILLANKDIDVVADLTKIGADVKKRMAEMQQEMNGLLEGYEQGLTAFSLAGAVGQIDREEIRAELGTARAEITDERRVRVTENEAMAQRVGLVSASVEEANAKIITEETARVSADEALAESLVGISSELGDRFAQGLVKFQAVAAPAGVDARFSVLLRGGVGQAYKDTGFFLELYTSGGVQKSRMAITVDQFSVSDGTAAYAVFAIEGGVVKIINAIMDMAQINNLVVGTSNIAAGAVTAAVGGETSVTIVHGTGSPLIRVDVSFVVRFSSSNYTTYNLHNNTDNVLMDNFNVSGSSGTTPVTRFYWFTPPSSRTQTTFSFEAANVSGVSVSGKAISAQAFKR